MAALAFETGLESVNLDGSGTREIFTVECLVIPKRLALVWQEVTSAEETKDSKSMTIHQS